MIAINSSGSRRMRFAAAVAVVLLICGFGAYRIQSAPKLPKTFRDFALVHTGAECLLDHCDPYTDNGLDFEKSQLGEWKRHALPFEPVYPPSTLLLLVPLARAGWPAAGLIWNVLSLAVYAAASVLLIFRLELERHWPALLALAALTGGFPLWLLMSTGNPSLMAAAAAVLGCVLIAPAGVIAGPGSSRERTAGWILLGYSLAFKPQVAVGAAVVLCLHSAVRRQAWKAIALGAAILLISVLAYASTTGSFHYLSSLMLANRLALEPGKSSDPSPANPDSINFLSLQGIPYALGFGGVVPGIFAWTVLAAAIFVAFLAQRRNNSWRELFWTSLAFGVLVSLFPVYHRSYDRFVLLMMIPGIVEQEAIGRGRVAQVLGLLAIFWVLADLAFQYRFGRLLNLPLNGMTEILMCVVMLWAMWSYRAPKHAVAIQEP